MVQKEVYKFICDPNSYTNTKEKLKPLLDSGKQGMIGVISVGIATVIGMNPIGVIPIIVGLAINVLIEAGVNVYCDIVNPDGKTTVQTGTVPS